MFYDKILIDVSNAYFRAYSVGMGMTTVVGDGTTLITGGIYTFLKMIKTIESRYLDPKGGSVFFLFDNCHSGINRRKEIDPSYKANRSKRDDGFYRSIDLLHMILLAYKDNYFCIKKEGYEADDLVYPVVKEFPEDKILLISNDLDWFRAVSDNVHIAKYEKAIGTSKVDYVIYDKKKFKERLGFEATESSMILYKSFRGDSSDNIAPAVPGIRSQDLNKIINNYQDVRDVLDHVDKLDVSDTWKEKIKTQAPRLLINEKLVSYQKVSYAELKDSIYECKFNPKSLHTLYLSLNFQISKIDPRVQMFFIKEEQEKKSEKKGFFVKEKIKRV